MKKTLLRLIGICLILGLVGLATGCEEVGVKKGIETKPTESVPAEPAE